MIAVAGGVVACLGGWRGDGLFVARDGGPLARVAELGWDAGRQTTPQRRLLLLGDEVLVLEPMAGSLLLPPLRVRRFDREGRERGREEGGTGGAAALSYHARAEGGRSRVTRCGVDPATGRPTVEETVLDADLPCGRDECSGIPLLHEGAWHYPVRMGGIFRGATRLIAMDPSPPQALGKDLACAGNRYGRPGVFTGGQWRPLEGPRLFPDWRAPMGTLVLPCGGGLLVLRREGGDLPRLGGAPPASLPEGIYSGLLDVLGRPTALSEGAEPALVPVRLPPGF